jgi:hypothetical protein
MMRRAAILLAATLLALAAGCGGGGKKTATQPPPATTTGKSSAATLNRAIRVALAANRRLSIYVLWHNTLPPWAARSTRGPALASLRAAARNRRSRGVRVRVLTSRRQVASIRLDPSYLRASAIVLDRQRVQPSGPSGHPLGRTVALNERARYELRRMAHGSGFVIWKVVLLK